MDFGDGQTSDFPNVDHVYLRPGLYTATLSIRRGARKAEITNRIYVDRPRTAPRDKPHVLDEYLRIIETYDPARLDAEALLQLALAFEAKALAQPDEADAYLNKAVRAVRAALQDCSAAEGDGLLNVARLAGPMTRFRLGDSAAAYQIWLGAAGKCGAPEAKAACEIAAADVAVNDLLRPADAKKLLESAAINLADDRAGTIAADLHRVWGDCRAAAGDGPAARKSYLEAERLIGARDRFNIETPNGSARQIDRRLFDCEAIRSSGGKIGYMLRRFSRARLDGLSDALYARFGRIARRHFQARRQADHSRGRPRFAIHGPVIDPRGRLRMRLGRKERRSPTLHGLVNDYPAVRWRRWRKRTSRYWKAENSVVKRHMQSSAVGIRLPPSATARVCTKARAGRLRRFNLKCPPRIHCYGPRLGRLTFFGGVYAGQRLLGLLNSRRPGFNEAVGVEILVVGT